jgi:hypothetical protein
MHSAPDRRLPTITTTQRGFSGNAAGAVQAFLSASGISDATQVSAVNTLYNDLVLTNITGTSLWDKIQVLYPFVGGNAAAHAVNLKNAVQYPLTFTGPIVHNNNGISGTASANAVISSTYDMASLSANDFSFGSYHRSPLSGSNLNSTALFNTSTGSTYLLYRGDAFTTTVSRFASISGSANVGITGSSTARFLAVTSNSSSTVLSFLNQFTVLNNITKGTVLTGTISASLSSSSGANTITMSVWYVATGMNETELIALNAIFQKYNDTLDDAFGSTRGTDYYINPNYSRDVNRFVSNIQIPGIATLTTDELNALQYLVTALQGSSTTLWGALTQIYPFVGSTIVGRMKELKSLGANTATYSGTFNFSTTLGLDPTSVSSLVIPSPALTISTPFSVGTYISEDLQSTGVDIGHSGSATRLAINARTTTNTTTGTVGQGGAVIGTGITNAKGHLTLTTLGNGTIGNSFTYYKNAVSLGSGTTTNTTTSGNAYIVGGTAGSSMRTQAITYIAQGVILTSAQIAELDGIILQYNLILGRT